MKTNSTLLKLVNVNLLCRTCVRRIQNMGVTRPLKVTYNGSGGLITIKNLLNIIFLMMNLCVPTSPF